MEGERKEASSTLANFRSIPIKIVEKSSKLSSSRKATDQMRSWSHRAETMKPPQNMNRPTKRFGVRTYQHTTWTQILKQLKKKADVKGNVMARSKQERRKLTQEVSDESKIEKTTEPKAIERDLTTRLKDMIAILLSIANKRDIQESSTQNIPANSPHLKPKNVGSIQAQATAIAGVKNDESNHKGGKEKVADRNPSTTERTSDLANNNLRDTGTEESFDYPENTSYRDDDTILKYMEEIGKYKNVVAKVEVLENKVVTAMNASNSAHKGCNHFTNESRFLSTIALEPQVDMVILEVCDSLTVASFEGSFTTDDGKEVPTKMILYNPEAEHNQEDSTCASYMGLQDIPATIVEHPKEEKTYYGTVDSRQRQVRSLSPRIPQMIR